MCTCAHQKVYTRVHITNIPIIGENQIEWRIVAYSPNGILYRDEKEQSTITWNNMDSI